MSTIGQNQSRLVRTGRVRIVVLLLLAVLVIVAVAWGFGSNGGGAASTDGAKDSLTRQLAGPSWVTVERRSFDLTVVASGELQARNQVELKSMVDGTTTIVEVVPEGSAVKKGDVLIRLADDQIREKVEQEILNVEQARADQIAAEQDLAIQQSEASNEEKAGDLKLGMARLDLEKWLKGDDVQKQRELRLAQEKATRSIERAKENLESSEQLYKENFISRSEWEDDKLALKEAEAAIETAKLNIEVYEKYTRPKELKKVQSDVDQAVAQLERTRRQNESKLAQAKARLQGRISQLRIREDRLKAMKDQLEKTVITAPQDGLVVYASTVGPRWARRGDPIAQGRQVRFNESLIILPDTSQMVARLKVHEAMVSRIRVGQKVTITIDAKPDKPLEGSVLEIGVMAEEGDWMNPDLRQYTVKVELPTQNGDGQAEELKPAMRCTGHVLIGNVENALAVPIQAVVTEGQDRFCYVRAPGDRVRRQLVTIGRSNESYVEIESGLDVGDQILIRRPRAGEVISEPAPAAKVPEPTPQPPQ